MVRRASSPNPGSVPNSSIPPPEQQHQSRLPVRLPVPTPLPLDPSPNIHPRDRFRPPNALELRETGGESIVAIDPEGTTVKMKGQEGMKGPDAQGFTFDRAFQMDTKQDEVYRYGISSIVDGESARAHCREEGWRWDERCWRGAACASGGTPVVGRSFGGRRRGGRGG